MIKELINPFGRVFLTIDVDTSNKWVYVNWKGYLTEENIKNGAQAYINALAEAGYNCVLNDTREIVGAWDHSMDWVLNTWAPTAARAGLKHFAMIANPDSFGGSSAATFYANLRAFKAQVFADKKKAEDWLRQICKSK